MCAAVHCLNTSKRTDLDVALPALSVGETLRCLGLLQLLNVVAAATLNACQHKRLHCKEVSPR